MGEGEVAFVPHVGNVKFIEKSNLKIEIQSKRSEAQVKDTDEYKLKEVIDLQRNIYIEAVAQCDSKWKKEQEQRDKILDQRKSAKFPIHLYSRFLQGLPEVPARVFQVLQHLSSPSQQIRACRFQEISLTHHLTPLLGELNQRLLAKAARH